MAKKEIPRQPHSEFAAGLVDKLTLGIEQRVGDWGATLIDQALAPIREAMDRLRHQPPWSEPCWCVQRWGGGKHDGPCEAARAVYESLKVK